LRNDSFGSLWFMFIQTYLYFKLESLSISI
jgi:hypothetical protein